MIFNFCVIRLFIDIRLLSTVSITTPEATVHNAPINYMYCKCCVYCVCRSKCVFRLWRHVNHSEPSQHKPQVRLATNGLAISL